MAHHAYTRSSKFLDVMKKVGYSRGLCSFVRTWTVSSRPLGQVQTRFMPTLVIPSSSWLYYASLP